MPLCGRCGKEAAGFAQIDSVRYCHSDDPYPTCYMLALWEQMGVPYWLKREKRGENEEIT